VSPEQTYSAAIYRALIERVTQVDYPVVSYKDGLMVVGEELARCKTAIAGPLSARWDAPQVNKQHGYLRERREWQWELVLRFDRHVNLEALEASLEDDPPSIARDAQHGRQVDILLTSARYVNPPQAAPSSGTEAVYTFKVQLTPV